jgi:hypothetical protein
MLDPDKFATIHFLFRSWHVTQISKNAYSSQVRFLMWEHRTQCPSQPSHLTSHTTSIPNTSHLIPESHLTPQSSHLTFNATHLSTICTHDMLYFQAQHSWSSESVPTQPSTNNGLSNIWMHQIQVLMNFSQFTMSLITKCI